MLRLIPEKRLTLSKFNLSPASFISVRGGLPSLLRG